MNFSKYQEVSGKPQWFPMCLKEGPGAFYVLSVGLRAFHETLGAFQMSIGSRGSLGHLRKSQQRFRGFQRVERVRGASGDLSDFSEGFTWIPGAYQRFPYSSTRLLQGFSGVLWRLL